MKQQQQLLLRKLTEADDTMEVCPDHILQQI